jgi:hypothetical protein
MPAYSGVVKFIGEKGDEALVYQTPTGVVDPDGYRLLHNAGFGAKAVGDSINYDYVTGFAMQDGDFITIS